MQAGKIELLPQTHAKIQCCGPVGLWYGLRLVDEGKVHFESSLTNRGDLTEQDNSICSTDRTAWLIAQIHAQSPKALKYLVNVCG